MVSTSMIYMLKGDHRASGILFYLILTNKSDCHLFGNKIHIPITFNQNTQRPHLHVYLLTCHVYLRSFHVYLHSFHKKQ